MTKNTKPLVIQSEQNNVVRVEFQTTDPNRTITDRELDIIKQQAEMCKERIDWLDTQIKIVEWLSKNNIKDSGDIDNIECQETRAFADSFNILEISWFLPTNYRNAKEIEYHI